MIAADASVAVAAFASWHEHHHVARAALADADGARLVAHCALETYSVLTRMPEPHRASSATIVEVLGRRFPDPHVALSSEEYRALVPRLAALGIVGGAVYDGLVALSARSAAAKLLSLDRRAASTYRRCETDYELLA